MWKVAYYVGTNIFCCEVQNPSDPWFSPMFRGHGVMAPTARHHKYLFSFSASLNFRKVGRFATYIECSKAKSVSASGAFFPDPMLTMLAEAVPYYKLVLAMPFIFAWV